MKSDLTCPVEVISVAVRREEVKAKAEPKVPTALEDAASESELEASALEEEVREQIVCEIEFRNLCEKETASIQMNIICFDADNQRLGGRLVRSAADGAPRGSFSGLFMPEHVDGTSRVEASVEKVWFKDGMLWRREERNVREYTPNQLPEGRELDRLRAVAGPDAAGYAREDDIVWMCVCGRANRTSEDRCMRCEREREQVMRDYSFAAIDSTVGKKERSLEEQTRDNLRRSSEQTVRHMTQQKKQEKRRWRRMSLVITMLILVALALAGLRWGLPYGANYLAQQKLSQGLAADAKEIFSWVNTYWPGFGDAGERAQQAEQLIIEGLITANTDESLAAAAKRAQQLKTSDAEALYEEAVLARAELAWASDDADGALAMLSGLPDSESAKQLQNTINYVVASDAQELLNYPLAIARFSELGEYEDAVARRDECIYLYGRQLMREGQYALASEQFMKVTGEPDAIALIRQCRYAVALEAQENGDYIAAAIAFESLGVYEEAETRAKLCRYTAGMNALEAGFLSVAAEQLKLAEDYEDAQEKFADVAFTLGNEAFEAGKFVEAIAWLEQLERGGEAEKVLDQAIYAYAQQLETQGLRDEAALQYGLLGNYEDAIERGNAIVYAIATEEMEKSPESALSRFESLGGYQDAQERADECRYALAVAHYAEGEYEAALNLFEQLKDFEDAKSQARRSRYALAGSMFEAKAYDEAAVQYEACGAYLQAEDLAMTSRYEAAVVLESEGAYQQAAAAFASLGSYEDAKARVTANEDSWLQKTYNSAWLDMDLGDYDSVIETLEDVHDEKLPERYAGIAQMYENACLERSKELIEQNRPLDALPVLERIAEHKTAKKRLDAYVYKLIGRWKDTKGKEFIFRRDGTCSIDGQELYYGGSGYEVFVGDAPYPAKRAYRVVSLKKGTFTLHEEETGKDFRMSYLGEPETAEEAGAETETKTTN